MVGVGWERIRIPKNLLRAGLNEIFFFLRMGGNSGWGGGEGIGNLGRIYSSHRIAWTWELKHWRNAVFYRGRQTFFFAFFPSPTTRWWSALRVHENPPATRPCSDVGNHTEENSCKRACWNPHTACLSPPNGLFFRESWGPCVTPHGRQPLLLLTRGVLFHLFQQAVN